MDNQKGIYSVITTAVSQLRADPWFGPRLSKNSDFLHASFEINNQRFNKAMTSAKCEWHESMLRFDGSNTTGFFLIEFKNQFFYYVTNKLKQVRYPVPLDAKWKADVDAAAKDVFATPVTRSRPNAAADEEGDSRINNAVAIEASKNHRQAKSL